jgi:serine O-acetyltransferase
MRRSGPCRSTGSGPDARDETAVAEDDVSILQNVTLDGTGKETGDRHPKIRRGTLIGAGAVVLVNIEVGGGAKIGDGGVRLRDLNE